MIRRLAILALLALATGPALADPATDTNFPLRVRYWQNYRSRQRTTRFGYPPAVLPAGYRMLEYVGATGDQYVDTGLNADSSLSYDVELSWTNAWTRTAQWPMGAWKNSSPYVRHYFGKTAATLAIWAETGSVKKATATFSANDGSRHRFSADLVHGIYSIDGVASTSTPAGFDVGMNFWLFARNGATPTYSTVRIYRALFWRSGVLVRDYIPAVDTNGVAGLWDRVSGTMSYSATATPLVAGPEVSAPVPTTVLPSVDRETVRGMLAPPEGAARQSGEVWLDCLAIPEGSWLVERPVAGGGTAWCAALCESNALRAVVWRYVEGVGPTNLPVTLEHDPARPIGRVEGLYYEQGTGVVARISISRAGWDWARTNRCVSPSPWIRCADTNLVVRTDGWRHEHQDYIEARCVPRGEDCSYTNVPASTSCLVLYPLYFRGLSLVRTPLLPTYVEREVPDHLRSAYPVNPRRQWDWR